MLTPPVFTSFQDAYIAVLEHIRQRAEHHSTARGNAACECLNLSFVVDAPADRIVFHPARRTNIAFCFAEALWYLQGRDDLEMIAYYAPGMARFSADGRTLTGTAYGPKLFAAAEDGLSQWDRVLDLLARDPDSKRAVLSVFDPRELRDADHLDVSCTLGLQFLLRDGRLHAVAYMRGNDAVVGLLSDVFSFTLLQELAARRLGVELGTYGHHVGSLHINDADAARAARIVAAAGHHRTRFPVPRMPVTAPSDLEILGRCEEELRRNQQRLDPVELGDLGLAPYWQQVVLLWEIYRQIVHCPHRPVEQAAMRALDPAYRWLIAHRWPDRLPEGFAIAKEEFSDVP